MARTRASVGMKVTFGKSSKARKVNVQPTPSSSKKGSSKNNYSGGNSYCPRETPDWQLPITRFFEVPSNGDKAGSGQCHHERPQIDSNANASDTESSDELIVETANNSEGFVEDVDQANSSLPPLVDDSSSHKIGEYFHTSEKKSSEIDDNSSGDSAEIKPVKNKGKGKSSKGKQTSEAMPLCDDTKENECNENVQKPSATKRILNDYEDNASEVNIKRLNISNQEI